MISSIDSVSSQTKTFSLSSKAQAILKSDGFEKIFTEKEAKQISSTESIRNLEQANKAMQGAEDAFAKMEQIRTQIEAAYSKLFTMFPK